MQRTLKISNTLSLPRDAATSTIVVYGGKGMGKTNLASVLVEEFAAAGIRFAVIDPMGVWWGLRHGADGKRDGIDVLILGGRHGDLPITPESGALVADLVVDEDANVIIDISRRIDGSMWAVAERIRFVTEYTKRLYQRQGERRRPLHQVIDEAARFAPQLVRAGDIEVAKCMGAVAVIVEEGRNVGVGVTLVTQRSARLNKDVAELADCMIAFRTLGPNSMHAVLDWLGEHVEKARLRDIGEQLRSLPCGSALVVSPGWLEFEGIVAMRKRTTFDSSATPKPGKRAAVPRHGRRPDLTKYRARLAELVEQTKANDPKQLRARIVELEKEAKARASKVEVVSTKIERKPINDVATKRIVKVIDRWRNTIDRADKAVTTLSKIATNVANAIDQARVALNETATKVTVKPEPQERAFARGDEYPFTPKIPPTRFSPKTKPTVTPSAHSATLQGREQKVLNAIGWWRSIGIDDPPATAVATLAGYSSTSSSFEKARGLLRSLGLIDARGMELTADGRAHAEIPSTPLDAATMHRAVMERLQGRERKVLQPVLQSWPDAIPQAVVAEMSGYSVTSSSFEKARGMLRGWGLIDYTNGDLIAANFLFPGAR